MYKIVCVFLLCISALQAGVVFRNCGKDTIGHFTKVTVSDCDENQQSCVLRRNTNATIGITFDITKDVTSVKAVVHGVIADVPVPFPFPQDDVCADKNSGITCPLSAAGGPYSYTATLFVEKGYPKLSLKVRWELKNEASEEIVCLEIPARIQ